MIIVSVTPPKEILREFGKRLARVRKQQDYTQAQLAKQAGIGVATLRRIEGGQDSQLESWIKLLTALQLSDSLNRLLPEQLDSPMATARAAGQRPRRHRSATPGSIWGDEF